jgi:two-component system chemotaxis response regulator CheY
MLTTDSDEARKSEGTAAGATGWLCKPFHPNSLVEAITRLA